MATVTTTGRRLVIGLGGVAAFALVLAGCAGGGSSPEGTEGTGGGEALTIGTTEQVTALDPANAYDNGSFTVMNQVYPFLLNSVPGEAEVQPDIAESAEFTGPKEYTVKLKEGLTFANGNELTSSDVKFSFDRQLAIASETGPSYLLGGMESVEAPDDLTVVFTLVAENDQTFPQVLSSPAGPIVDEEVFPADAALSDDEIVAAQPFAGQYVIDSYDFNNLIAYTANESYEGLLGAPATNEVNVRYYTDASNLKLDVQEGNIDVANRTLSATDIDDLRGNDNVKVVDGPGGEIRYLVFNFDTMPYGATTADADPAKALAVRQAIANVIDRDAIAEEVYRGTVQPLYSYLPEGVPGATVSLRDAYGDGNGAPDVDQATEILEAAGVETPVELNIQYVAERYGPSSGDEYAVIKDSLDASGLFTANIQSTEWVTYSKDRVADAYPIYQLGWFPDYADPDNYLTPFFATDNFLANHYENAEVDALLKQQVATVDEAERLGLIEQIQDLVAQDLSTIPYMAVAQNAVTGPTVTGVENTLDPTFKFRYGVIAKG
ncbi:MAG: ABC transporter substrate-binding protein [Aeromicrobium sp.]